MNQQTTSPWPPEKFECWYREHQVIPSRDYRQTLVPRILALSEREGFIVKKYGEATYSTNNLETGAIDYVTHDLFQVLVGDFNPDKPTYIVIGGTHGYEKGGPLAALGFAEEEAANYAATCNLIIFPCLCPGPFEKETRYTEGRIDPNRDAMPEGSQSQEMQKLAASLKELHKTMYGGDLTRKFTAAIDLHETPKMDLEISRESAEAGGETFELGDFPEGLFIISFDDNKTAAQKIIDHIRSEGHKIVESTELYGTPAASPGLLLTGPIGQPNGRVRSLTSIYTHSNFTVEFCGMGITDQDMPDDERAEPQRAAIRGMLRQHSME